MGEWTSLHPFTNINLGTQKPNFQKIYILLMSNSHIPMNQETLHFTPKHYASGEIIEVNEDALRELIRKGEKALGWEHQERDVRIIYLPDDFIARMGVHAAYSFRDNAIATPQRQHEATLFHEGIHYLMAQEGLLFGPSLKKATFYDRLMDETIAEFAAFESYGYDDITANLMGFYERLKSGSPEAVEELLSRFLNGVPQEMYPALKSTIARMNFPQLQMAKKQRSVERKYFQTRNFESIEEDVDSLYGYIDSVSSLFSPINISEAVRIIATGNAVALGNAGIELKELVAWLNDGVANEWDSYGLYFYDIVINIQS